MASLAGVQRKARNSRVVRRGGGPSPALAVRPSTRVGSGRLGKRRRLPSVKVRLRSLLPLRILHLQQREWSVALPTFVLTFASMRGHLWQTCKYSCVEVHRSQLHVLHMRGLGVTVAFSLWYRALDFQGRYASGRSKRNILALEVTLQRQIAKNRNDAYIHLMENLS